METSGAEAAYALLREALNERQWRLYVALEAQKYGYGGISRVAREARTTRATIQKGIAELQQGQVYRDGGRIRGVGGGRKPLTAHDPTLIADLEGLLDPRGDPMSVLKWTTKSYSGPRDLDSERGLKT